IDFAISRPIVLTACMIGSSESWGPQQHPLSWHSRAGGGAVHSINSGHARSLGERGNGGFPDLLAPLLDEVTAGWNPERRGPPAYLLTQCCHHRRSQYRVFHPDGHEGLPAPLMRPPFSGAPRDVDALHLGRHHHQLGKASYARLIASVGKRRGVGF